MSRRWPLPVIAARRGMETASRVARLRRIEDAFAADPNRCDHCEAPLSASVITHHGRYCDAWCRKEASRARRKETRA